MGSEIRKLSGGIVPQLQGFGICGSTLRRLCDVVACELDGLVFRVSSTLICYVSVVFTKTSEVEG